MRYRLENMGFSLVDDDHSTSKNDVQVSKFLSFHEIKY